MKKISIIKRNADNNDREFWKTKTPEERISAVRSNSSESNVLSFRDMIICLPLLWKSI
jgi:hypothetical protein